MKNLGSAFFILLIFQAYAYALVVASVDSSHVQRGDTVTLSISLKGEDIKRPELYTVCGENVTATGSSTSHRYINGDYEKEYILTYQFVATQSCTIEAIDVSLNGKTETTLPLDIKVDKTLLSQDSEFSLEMVSDVNEVYVGEAFEVALLFKQKKSAQFVDNKFTQPSFQGFWVKGEPQQFSADDGVHNITKIVYKLAPQREGVLKIEAANIKLAKRKNTRNYFGGMFPDVKWKTYFSNDLNISAKALPNGIELVGDFQIEAFVNKTQVNPNEAVNLTIKVSGNGNLEDIKSFKPHIDGVSVFDEKITIQDNVLTQKIAFVGDSSFSIPAFRLKTFNTTTGKEQVIATQAIEIAIDNAKEKEEIKIHREEKEYKEPRQTEEVVSLNKYYLVGAVIFGFILGVLSMFLRPFVHFEKTKKLDLKDTKMLLVKLMPFRENEDVKELVNTLESNLYSKDSKELDKKVLKEIIHKYKIN